MLYAIEKRPYAIERESLKYLIIGDLGWKYYFHLGDEAMSLAAAETLVQLGNQTALIAGDPQPTTARYGYESYRRPGIKKAMSLKEKEDYLTAITQGIAGHGQIPAASSSALEGVQSADVVVIGGGGNLNSAGEHHLYDRVALARMARQFEKPLVISSQTVGPALTARQRELVQELAHEALVFGSRESTTFQLMKEISTKPEKVVQTADDAMLLAPANFGKLSRDLVTTKITGDYIVASFTAHSGTSGIDKKRYAQLLANLCDMIANRFDLDVLLLPHLGRFQPAEKSGDELLNENIVSKSASGRLQSVPIVESSVYLSLLRDAKFSISTRYHPLVFGPAVETPAFGIELSDYSKVRMRGALENYGLSQFSFDWNVLIQPDRFVNFLAEVFSHDNAVRLQQHLSWVSGLRRAEQQSFWKTVSQSIKLALPLQFTQMKNIPEWTI